MDSKNLMQLEEALKLIMDFSENLKDKVPEASKSKIEEANKRAKADLDDLKKAFDDLMKQNNV